MNIACKTAEELSEACMAAECQWLVGKPKQLHMRSRLRPPGEKNISVIFWRSALKIAWLLWRVHSLLWLGFLQPKCQNAFEQDAEHMKFVGPSDFVSGISMWKWVWKNYRIMMSRQDDGLQVVVSFTPYLWDTPVEIGSGEQKNCILLCLAISRADQPSWSKDSI